MPQPYIESATALSNSAWGVLSLTCYASEPCGASHPHFLLRTISIYSFFFNQRILYLLVHYIYIQFHHNAYNSYIALYLLTVAT